MVSLAVKESCGYTIDTLHDSVRVHPNYVSHVQDSVAATYSSVNLSLDYLFTNLLEPNLVNMTEKGKLLVTKEFKALQLIYTRNSESYKDFQTSGKNMFWF